MLIRIETAVSPTGINGLLPRSVRLIAQVDALNSMGAGRDSGQAQRSGFVHDALTDAVQENLNAVPVGLNDERAELRGRFGRNARAARIERQHHIGIEAAALGCGVLALAGGVPDVGMNVFGEFVGGHHAIAGSIGFALQSFNDVVRENAMAATPLRALEGLLPVAAGGEGEQRAVQIE